MNIGDVMGFMFPFDNETLLFLSIFTFMWLTYLWDTYLDYRQQKILNTHLKPTEEVSLIMTEENYSKARLYSLDTKRFGLYQKLFQMIESSLILIFGVLPWLWNGITSQINRSGKLSTKEELTGSMVFLLIVTIYSFITGMPWKVYSTFVIEAKHGFNKQTPIYFIKDQIKSLLVSIVLMLPISYCLLLVIKIGGPYFYVYAWVFAVLIMMFLMFIYPEFIAPLFDKYTLLPDGALKASIENLASKIEFPLKKIYVVEGSKRSSHSNAYFYGFWKNKRIVLFDTLLQSPLEMESDKKVDENLDGVAAPKKGCLNEEIVAILAHELGHWKLNHVVQNMVIGQLNLFLMLFAFGLLFNLNILFRSFGFVDIETPTLIRLMLIFCYLFSPYHFVLEFFMTVLSRKKEFQADDFAVKLGFGTEIVNGLVKLHNDNLSFPIFDRLYSMFNHSHPPILERIAAIKAHDESKKQL